MTEVQDDVWNLSFDVGKSKRYHAYRRSFWQGWDYWTKVSSIVTGASVVISVAGEKSVLAAVFAVLVALSSAADVVLGFGSRAKLHDELYRRWADLDIAIESLQAPTTEQVSALRRVRLEIERDEPTVLDLLERRCSAEECLGRGCEVRESWKLSRWEFRISQFAFWTAVPPKALRA